MEQAHEGVRLHVRVQPRASRSQVVGWLADGSLKVVVASPPVDGAANKACIALLAETFDLPKRDILLASGEKQTANHVPRGRESRPQRRMSMRQW